MTTTPRIVEVRQNVLKHNDEIARALRSRFQQAGVFVVSLVSSPGSGKTTFLERALTLLRQQCRPAALVGDLATDNDALRLARSQVPVKQITTGSLCHLEAAMVERTLQGWNLEDIDIVFIENVGNLVCPASYDLGENLRLVLLSVTEGEDKPLKYPTIFNSADLAVVTKMDLAEVVEFDRTATKANIEAVRPGMQVFELSAKTGQGIDELLAYLQQKSTRARLLQEKLSRNARTARARAT
jgi:hydrogenase nickel incorporation protein HypB